MLFGVKATRLQLLQLPPPSFFFFSRRTQGPTASTRIDAGATGYRIERALTVEPSAAGGRLQLQRSRLVPLPLFHLPVPLVLLRCRFNSF